MTRLAIYGLLLCGAAPAMAAERPAALMQGLQECRVITAADARLACFDTAAAAIADATEKRDIVVMDREGLKETRKSLFGFTLPPLSLFGGGNKDKDSKDDRIESVDLVVKSARLVNYNEWRMVMEDGSIWVTTEPLASKAPGPGAAAHITRGAIGNYFVKIGNGQRVRVRREG